MKKNKGITLIALIVTIIILLILAGITINFMLGDNGLINRAKDAKIKTEIASIKEEIQTEILAKQVENEGNISDDNLKEILEKYGVLSEEGEKLIDKTLTTTKGNYDIKVSDIFNGTVKDRPKEPVIADKSGANSPNITNMAQKTYVTWTEKNGIYEINDKQNTQPDNWYDYENGKWANIKTTNNIENLEAYWVWIPRYEYIVPTSATAEKIEVRFIGTDKKEGAEGYTKQSDGTIQSSDGYTIHPAFWWDTNDNGIEDTGEQLDGIWVAKFEAVSNTPTATNGGGNNTDLKVQIIPNQPSWRYIQTTNMFTVCRDMQTTGVLAGSTKIDSHMMKNTEWGAVAILSQSKYGIYNPSSKTGTTEGIGDGTLQIWNNSSSSYITGSVGTRKDASNEPVSEYNSANGPKASTTGTVYGVYDMAGGAWEYTAGCLNGQENAKFGVKLGNSKYLDLYTNSSIDSTKIGDATKETKGWNGDYFVFVVSSSPVFIRGRLLQL